MEPVPTRERLLERTIEVIEEHGVPAVRVHSIAAAAGVTVPSVYHFFGSKEGLIEAAQSERYGRALRATNHDLVLLIDRSDDAESFRDGARALLSSYFGPEGAHQRMVRINALGSAYAHPELLAAINATQAQVAADFAGLIERAQVRGWVRADVCPQALASWLMGALLGRALIELGPTPVDPEEWNRTYLEAAFMMLFGTSSQAPAPSSDALSS